MVLRFLESFDHLHPSHQLTLGFGIIGVLGIIDYVTGFEVAFAVFYVFPITLLTWNLGVKTGLIASCLSALIWLAADIGSGNQYSHTLIPLWNTVIRLTFFLIIINLLTELRKIFNREQLWARTDSLTGAANVRLFYELLRFQIARTNRCGESFTLVYIDLDNFKSINDRLGHSVGNQLLQAFVDVLKGNLRQVDTIARIGGDEFALLLPNTNEKSARTAVAKVQREVGKLMRFEKWPVTLSMGVVTCLDAPTSADELIGLADSLMYKVKHGKKDNAEFLTFQRVPDKKLSMG